MKKFIIIIVIPLIVLAITMGLYCLYMKSTTDRQLEIANEIIESSDQNKLEIVTKEELEINENIIGLLEIPLLNLVAPIQEGTTEEVLKVAIGHFEESSFWNGNVALASHNRSQYVHYFEKINELQINDEIIYKTKLGTRKYIVYENSIIDETDWSVIENTNENIITLITCVKNYPQSRLCVKAKEI